jgi:hypothetical protein
MISRAAIIEVGKIGTWAIIKIISAKTISIRTMERTQDASIIATRKYSFI